MKYTTLPGRAQAALLPLSIAVLLFFSCSLWQKIARVRLEYTIGMDLGDLMSRLSEHSQDSLFNAAVRQADQRSQDDTVVFMDELARIYSQSSNAGKLAPVFASLGPYQGTISASDPNEKVLTVLTSSLHQEMDRVAQVLLKRADVYGLPADNDVKADYTHGTLVIHLRAYDEKSVPGISRILSTRGKLEMWDTYENEEIISALIDADKALAGLGITTTERAHAKRSTPTVAEKLGLPDSIVEKSKLADKAAADSLNRNPLLRILYPRVDNMNGIYPGAAIGVAYAKDTATVDILMNIASLKGLFPRDVKFLWGSKPTGSGDVYELYAIKFNPATRTAPVSNDAITDVKQGFDASGLPDLIIKMNVHGSIRWEQMTDGAANAMIEVNGRSKAVNKCVAIVIDDRVFSAPRVMNKISGGNTQITGLSSLDEAKELEAILNGGVAKCRLRILEEKVLDGK